MITEKFFLNRFSYPILFIPFLLITGPFLPDLFLSLSCLFFLFLIFKTKNYLIFNNLFFKIFLTFWILIIISSLLSDNLLMSLKSSFFYIRFGLFIIILKFFFNKIANFEKKFLLIGFISIFIVILSVLVEYIFNRYGYDGKDVNDVYNIYNNITHNLIRFGFNFNWSDNRISGLFASEGVAGSYVLRLYPFFFIFLLNNIYSSKISKKLKFGFNLFFILSVFTVLVSGERSAFILLMINIFLTLIIVKKLRLFFKYSIVASIIIVIFSINFDPVLKRILQTSLVNLKKTSNTEHQFNNIPDTDPEPKKGEQNIYLITAVHQGHFYGAWKIFLDNKFLGAGMKGYRHQCYNNTKYKNDKKIYCSTHPHNTLMQFLSETGISGTLFYFSILSIVIYKIIYFFFQVNFKKKITDYNFDSKICALVGIFINIWPIASTGNFFNNWLSIIYYLPIIFYLNKSKILNNA